LIAVNIDKMNPGCKDNSDDQAKLAMHSDDGVQTIDEMLNADTVDVNDVKVRKFLRSLFDELSKMIEAWPEED
jgi:hypothetical protein